MNTSTSANPVFLKVDLRYLYLLGEFTWFLTLYALTEVSSTIQDFLDYSGVLSDVSDKIWQVKTQRMEKK